MAVESKSAGNVAAPKDEKSRIAKMQESRKFRSQMVDKLDPQQRQALRMIVAARKTIETAEDLCIQQKPLSIEFLQALGQLQSASAGLLYQR